MRVWYSERHDGRAELTLQTVQQGSRLHDRNVITLKLGDRTFERRVLLGHGCGIAEIEPIEGLVSASEPWRAVYLDVIEVRELEMPIATLAELAREGVARFIATYREQYSDGSQLFELGRVLVEIPAGAVYRLPNHGRSGHVLGCSVQRARQYGYDATLVRLSGGFGGTRLLVRASTIIARGDITIEIEVPRG